MLETTLLSPLRVSVRGADEFKTSVTSTRSFVHGDCRKAIVKYLSDLFEAKDKENQSFKLLCRAVRRVLNNLQMESEWDVPASP